MKHCTLCQKSRSRKAFTTYEYGRRWSRCRLCMRTLNVRRNQTMVAKWHNTRQSAARRKIRFTLTKTQFVKLLARPCVYGSWIHGMNTHVGIDRKDNSKGYISSNCVPCCGRHNSIKGTWFTYHQMLKIVRSHPLLRECGLNDSGRPPLVSMV
jgi:hypothetical protein